MGEVRKELVELFGDALWMLASAFAVFLVLLAGRCSAQDSYRGVPHAASPTAFWPRSPAELPDDAGWAPCCEGTEPYPHIIEVNPPKLGQTLWLSLSQSLPECGASTWVVTWGIAGGAPLLMPFLLGGRCEIPFSMANEPYANDWLTPGFYLTFNQFPLAGTVPTIGWTIPNDPILLGKPFYAQAVITRFEGSFPHTLLIGQVRTWLLETSPVR